MSEHMRGFTKEEAEAYNQSLKKLFKPRCATITNEDVINFIIATVEPEESLSYINSSISDLIKYLKAHPELQLSTPVKLDI